LKKEVICKTALTSFWINRFTESEHLKTVQKTANSTSRSYWKLTNSSTQHLSCYAFIRNLPTSEERISENKVLYDARSLEIRCWHHYSSMIFVTAAPTQ